MLVVRYGPTSPRLLRQRPVNVGFPYRFRGCCMGSLVKKRRKKMSKHKYRKRIKANRHKRKR